MPLDTPTPALCLTSSSPPIGPLPLSPFYRRGNRGPQSPSDVAKITPSTAFPLSPCPHTDAAQMLLEDADRGFLLWASQGPVTPQTKENRFALPQPFLKGQQLGVGPQVLTAAEKCPAKSQGRKPETCAGAPRGTVLPPRSTDPSTLCPRLPFTGEEVPARPPACSEPERRFSWPLTGQGMTDSRLSEPHLLPAFCCPDKPGVSARLENVCLLFLKKKSCFCGFQNVLVRGTSNLTA